MKLSRLLIGSSVLALVSMSSAAAAWAQAASEGSSTQVEEVIVTAQKREQSIQAVPFAISAIAGPQLEDLGGRGFDTLGNRIPGLQIFGIGQNNMQLAIRGVNTERQRSNRATSVSIYFDEIPVDLGAANPNFQLFDLERVEVLRGPQGTLYGAGAEAGALRIITRKPRLGSFDWAGGVEGSKTESGGLNGLAYGVVNLPLSDTAAVRLLAYDRHDQGYIDNVTLDKKNTNTNNLTGARAEFLVKPTDKLSLTLTGMFQRSRQDDADWFNPALGDLKIGLSRLEDITSRSANISGTLAYDLPFAQFTSITAYQDTNFDRNQVVDRYPVILGAPAGRFTAVPLPTNIFGNASSQEFRLTSPSGKRLEWVAGLYYADVERGLGQSLDVPGIESAVPTLARASTFGLPTDRVYQGDADTKTRQTAGYVDGTLHVTDNLDLSAGVRLASNKTSGVITYRGALQGEVDQVINRGTDHQVAPRFNVTYNFNRDVRVYAQAAKGYRLGGINEPVPQSLCGADLTALGINPVPQIYRPDSLWNYEGGLKSQFADRRITLNVDYFYIKYKDIQVTRRLPCTYSVIQNAGEMTSKGWEGETRLAVTESLTLGANATYTDATITQAAPGLGAGVTGARAPFVPKWAYDVSLDYRQPLFEGFGYFSVDYGYTGDRGTDLTPASSFDLPAFSVWNARVGLSGKGWETYLFGDNLTDKRGRVDITRDTTASLTPYFRNTVIRPRTIGVRVLRQF
jgi:outer membrane receptor protein involved in Fe transport